MKGKIQMQCGAEAKKGFVVLEPGTRLREGMQVTVPPVPDGTNETEETLEMEELRNGLKRVSAITKDGPPDLARNHDYYLHGTPIK